MKFLDYLKKNKVKKIFIDKCSGNNGDQLIWLGMLEVLKKVELDIVECLEQAELIIINGGGMFIDAYTQGIDKVEYYTRHYPDLELCIAPNSFRFSLVDFSSVLNLRTAEMAIFSREKYSEGYIKKLIKKNNLISSYLDKDLAFHLEGSQFIDDIKREFPVPVKGNVLIVDRMDVEHPKMKEGSRNIREIYANFVPEILKQFYRKLRLINRVEFGTEFTKQARNKILESNSKYEIESLETSDISRVDICSFEEFIKKIAESDYLFTNRLHVGILGHLLERNTYMSEGSYYKMTGIYEMSMSSQSTTKILNKY